MIMQDVICFGWLYGMFTVI